MQARAHPGQVAVALGVTAIGLLFFAGSFWLPGAGGYAQVGPAWVPRGVGFALLVLSGFLLREALTGGFRAHDEATERALATDWRAFGWVSAGLVVYGLLVERAGFVLASAVLFVLVARGFGSRRWTSNIVIGLVLGVSIFAAFNYGLRFPLPKGILAPLLP